MFTRSMLLVILASTSLFARLAGATDLRGDGKIKTELWTVGDDGLTQKFSMVLREAIVHSRDFQLSVGSSKGDLRMTIPSNLYWQTAQHKINFHVVVVFTRGEKYIGIHTSPCWEADMKACAEGVLDSARLSLRRESKKSQSIPGAIAPR